MATIGKLSEFQPEKERISAYLERVQMFFEANDIAAEKQVAVLLTAIGGETCPRIRVSRNYRKSSSAILNRSHS